MCMYLVVQFLRKCFRVFLVVRVRCSTFLWQNLTKLISVEIVLLIIRMTVWTYYKTHFFIIVILYCRMWFCEGNSKGFWSRWMWTNFLWFDHEIPEYWRDNSEYHSGRWLYFHSWNIIEKYRFSEIDRCLKSCFDMRKQWTEWSVSIEFVHFTFSIQCWFLLWNIEDSSSCLFQTDYPIVFSNKKTNWALHESANFGSVFASMIFDIRRTSNAFLY